MPFHTYSLLVGYDVQPKPTKLKSLTFYAITQYTIEYICIETLKFSNLLHVK